jgi:hypothetical protein
MSDEHICQVYDFTAYREALIDIRKEKEKREAEKITLDLFTIRDMITKGYDPSSTDSVVKYWGDLQDG